MAPPPRPEVDKRSFGPDFLRYHERLVPFFDGTIAALATMYGLELVTTTPIRITAPSEWRDVLPTEMLNSWQLYPNNIAPLAQYRLRIRKTAEGVEVRGLVMPPLPSALGVPFRWPDGYAPAQEEIYGLRGELQTAEVRTSPLGPNVTNRSTMGSPAQGWVSLSGLRFAPLSPVLPAPAKPFPISVAWKAYPSLVFVQSTLIDANNRATSQRQLHLVTWTAPPERSAGAFLMTRIQGLAAGAKYDLMVYAAA
jgi:hypothetical protein